MLSHDKQINDLIQTQKWDELSNLLDRRMDAIISELSEELPAKEKKALIQQLLDRDIQYLKAVITQKKEIEQQLLTLKRGRKAQKFYVEEA